MPVIRENLTDLELIRAQAKSYVQSFFVDVVIYRMNGKVAFIQDGLLPEGGEEVEHITIYYGGTL